MEAIEFSVPNIQMFVISVLCGAVLFFYYIFHYSFTAYTRSFGFTILVVVVLMAAILNSVGNNIAASISLFGALSLLRFRSIVKSTDDMGFLLASVTLGVVVGTRNYQLLMPVLLIIGFLVVVFKFLRVSSLSETQTINIYYHGDLRVEYIIKTLKSFGLKNVYIKAKSVQLKNGNRKLKICCSGCPSDSIQLIDSLLVIDGVDQVKAVTNEET